MVNFILDFSNTVKQTDIKGMAEADDHEMVKELQVLKTLSHGAIFFATCNAILLLVDVKLANTLFHHSLLIYN